MKEFYNVLVENFGTPLTLKRRIEYYGNELTYSISNTGGNIPQGTYYYLATAIHDNVEEAPPKSIKVSINTGVETNKVTLTLPSLPVNSWKIYRSTNPVFTSPSYIGSTSSNIFEDTLATPNSGEPPKNYGDPILFYSTSVIKGLISRIKTLAKVRYDIKEVDIGTEVYNAYYVFIKSDVEVQIKDFISFNGEDYKIVNIFPYFVNDEIILKRLSVELEIGK